MINRKELVSRHNPVLTKITPESPLTVGNGEFAYSVDITGMQTLYEEYMQETPLCTMAAWGWHTIPCSNKKGYYTNEDLSVNEYDFCGRKVTYPITKTKVNEEVYNWLRQNPHKFNLARIGLFFLGEPITSRMITNIHQELNLYTGIIRSRFCVKGIPCVVDTLCDAKDDCVAFSVESDLLINGLTVDILFPYGNSSISGSDWSSPKHHSTEYRDGIYDRKLDQEQYYVKQELENAYVTKVQNHHYRITGKQNQIYITLTFGEDKKSSTNAFSNVIKDCVVDWKNFWENGGAVSFAGSTNPAAEELERRVVLSQYLLKINSCGSMPPQETGLTCNSWYGKAHLEMYYWHLAWAPLWHHNELLLRSVSWYQKNILKARNNALKNGYAGVRWPKMVGWDAIDSPSKIAPLLVWQQPHIIMLLELIRRDYAQSKSTAIESFMQENWNLIFETATFMVDYVVKDSKTGIYHIEPPVIPVQERHAPMDTKDPSFEVAYWKYGLEVAISWAKHLHQEIDEKWIDVYEHMALPPQANDLYIAQSNCPDTFEKVAIDHPLMLQNYGMLPGTDIEPKVMENTLEAVLKNWNYDTLWGWDFAVIAMTATRLHKPALAIEQLLCDSIKNCYVESGNNRQNTRKDLPLYLPGNGSLLIAVAMMVAGYDGCEGKNPGFPDDGTWKVEWEHINPYI